MTEILSTATTPHVRAGKSAAKHVKTLPVDGHLRVQVLSVTPLPGSRVRAVKH